jgi:hypothetical protein
MIVSRDDILRSDRKLNTAAAIAANIVIKATHVSSGRTQKFELNSRHYTRRVNATGVVLPRDGVLNLSSTVAGIVATSASVEGQKVKNLAETATPPAARQRAGVIGRNRKSGVRRRLFLGGSGSVPAYQGRDERGFGIRGRSDARPQL